MYLTLPVVAWVKGSLKTANDTLSTIIYALLMSPKATGTAFFAIVVIYSYTIYQESGLVADSTQSVF